MSLVDLIVQQIRARGPITVAEFIDLALYHPGLGYYSTARQRSGRAGDFFTSLDLGPFFGELLAAQIEDFWQILGSPSTFDLVEAGAGSGRLARDVLEAARRDAPALYRAIVLHLVERSPVARSAQRETLGPHADKLASSLEELPAGVRGVMYANELLDALPVHLVVMRDQGLMEVRVGERDGTLFTLEGPPTTPDLARYLTSVGATLRPGSTAEVGLAAESWVRRAAGSLTHGFLMLIDYGYDAAELYSPAHASGTLRSFHAHTLDVSPEGWLADPGTRDITSHVDLTGVRQAAERGGLASLAALDQTYFVLGFAGHDRLMQSTGDPVQDLKRRLAMKTLLVPGGLGSSHKVVIFGRNVGSPSLKCTSFRQRISP